LDGWSMPLLMSEVFSSYASRIRGERARLPERRPYRDYIAWLKKQDLGLAEQYWRRALEGFISPTPLGIGDGRGVVNRTTKVERRRTRLGSETAGRVEGMGQGH